MGKTFQKITSWLANRRRLKFNGPKVFGEKGVNCNKWFEMKEKYNALLLVVKEYPGQDTERGFWISLGGRVVHVKIEKSPQKSSFFPWLNHC